MGFGCHKHSLVSKVSLLNLLFSPNLTEGHSSQDWGALGSLLTAQRYAWEKPVPPQHRVRHGCHNTKITTQSRYYLTLLQTASSPIFQSAGGRGRLVTGSLCWRLPSPASFTMVTKWWPIVDLTSAIHALAVLGVTLVVHAYIKGKKKKQLSRAEVSTSKEISRRRIRVEQVIGWMIALHFMKGFSDHIAILVAALYAKVG